MSGKGESVGVGGYPRKERGDDRFWSGRSSSCGVLVDGLSVGQALQCEPRRPVAARGGGGVVSAPAQSLKQTGVYL